MTESPTNSSLGVAILVLYSLALFELGAIVGAIVVALL